MFNSTFDKEEQPWNKLWLIRVIFAGNEKLIKDEQFANTDWLIEVTESGIIMLFKEEQPLKALDWIDNKVEGNLIFSKLEFPKLEFPNLEFLSLVSSPDLTHESHYK